ncbi:MAG: Crp/Fnr family transcriptional regulator [Rhodospirillales bacterium]|nr:Crp/Fnr family transcriptional regulator [Acetobacter sp.]
MPRMPMANAWIQVSGPMAVIPATILRTLVDVQPLVQTALSRYLYSLSAQCLQTVACNRLHNLEQRCCRWLLMLADCLGSDDVPLTQDALATILDSGRSRINALLASLEQERLLQRSRGRIRLASRVRLQQKSCECYRLSQRDAGAGLLPRFTSNVA